MTGMTLKQMAIQRLRNATVAYIDAHDRINEPNGKTAFTAACVRLHIARGSDVPKSYVTASKRQTNGLDKTR